MIAGSPGGVSFSGLSFKIFFGGGDGVAIVTFVEPPTDLWWLVVEKLDSVRLSASKSRKESLSTLAIHAPWAYSASVLVSFYSNWFVIPWGGFILGRNG